MEPQDNQENLEIQEQSAMKRQQDQETNSPESTSRGQTDELIKNLIQTPEKVADPPPEAAEVVAGGGQDEDKRVHYFMGCGQNFNLGNYFLKKYSKASTGPGLDNPMSPQWEDRDCVDMDSGQDGAVDFMVPLRGWQVEARRGMAQPVTSLAGECPDLSISDKEEAVRVELELLGLLGKNLNNLGQENYGESDQGILVNPLLRLGLGLSDGIELENHALAHHEPSLDEVAFGFDVNHGPERESQDLEKVHDSKKQRLKSRVPILKIWNTDGTVVSNGNGKVRMDDKKSKRKTDSLPQKERESEDLEKARDSKKQRPKSRVPILKIWNTDGTVVGNGNGKVRMDDKKSKRKVDFLPQPERECEHLEKACDSKEPRPNSHLPMLKIWNSNGTVESNGNGKVRMDGEKSKCKSDVLPLPEREIEDLEKARDSKKQKPKSRVPMMKIWNTDGTGNSNGNGKVRMDDEKSKCKSNVLPRPKRESECQEMARDSKKQKPNSRTPMLKIWNTNGTGECYGNGKVKMDSNKSECKADFLPKPEKPDATENNFSSTAISVSATGNPENHHNQNHHSFDFHKPIMENNPAQPETTPMPGPIQKKHSSGCSIPVKYKCSICNKVVSSHQALGGHKSSHKRFKMSIDNTTDYVDNPNKDRFPLRNAKNNGIQQEARVSFTSAENGEDDKGGKEGEEKVVRRGFDLNRMPEEEDEAGDDESDV